MRRRMVNGDYQEGDVAAFRAAFRSVSQARFAEALGISVRYFAGIQKNVGH